MIKCAWWLCDNKANKNGTCSRACSLKLAVDKRRRKIRLILVYEHGGKCTKCGYDKCIDALEFHHRNPKEKKFGISQSGNTRAIDEVRLEASKCDLVCSNCHREMESLPYKPRWELAKQEINLR